ncbi:prolyl oligopeptidase family serine peptidase [Bacillus nitratireducens]|uniref:prolyl oligopeptidase family serine peptidase n=1 Tax=Bacillus nitratireducens TaxID=2026193 RepID=UPI00089A5753|nr:prolyl oligopeptidase family serine peptidase [Bacillus nitratireducens]PEB80386.1 phospholipase [Bacillus cereus]PFH79679.1 phospholipase [Bacillus cereus]SEA76055.1 Predicted peptidase [Bacillus nitratireducens]
MSVMKSTYFEGGHLLKKIRKFPILCMVIGSLAGGLVLSGCSSESKDKDLKDSDITLITNVLPYGEVGATVVCDFGDTIDSSKLTKDSFKVEVEVNGKPQNRKINKVYTNNKAEVSETSKDGQYVVIELDENDKYASTSTFNEEKFLSTRDNLDYKLSLTKDIKTKDGANFKASEQKNKISNVVTPVVDDFKKGVYQDTSGSKMQYRLFEPKKEANKKYPLVLFLHGSGERGNDNYMQVVGNEGAVAWANPEQQKKNPAYVLAPQVEATETLTAYWTEEPNYSTMLNLLKETIDKYDIDKNRIYVVGMSNGGIGTWNVIKKNPDLFAAAVPICGIGDLPENKLVSEYEPMQDTSVFKDIKDMPIWVFHAEDDPLVDVRYSRDAVQAIKELGGSLVKYTEYPTGIVQPMGHFSWVPALQDKEMINWLFNQSK